LSKNCLLSGLSCLTTIPVNYRTNPMAYCAQNMGAVTSGDAQP